jgi:hypothetical protein
MERLNLKNKVGLYIVSLFIMAMPLVIFGLVKVFTLGEPITLSNIDWFWSAACLLSGLLLLVRLKIAWILAMIQIFTVTILNMIQLLASLQIEGSAIQYNFQFLFSVMTLAIVLLIASYFKYPYLDRRDTILMGIANRYKVSMDGDLNDAIAGKIISASISGVLMHLDEPRPFKIHHVYNLTVADLDVVDEIVSVVSVQDKEIRLKFESLPLRKMRYIRKKLKGFPREA